MSTTQVKTLISAFESVRSLSKFYMANLDVNKVHERIEVNGIKFNSAYWLVTHLTWTELYLITRGIGGKEMDDHWLDEYGIGTNPDEIKTKPDYSEVVKLFDEVHANAVEILNSITDDQLDEPNHLGISFGGKNNKRAVLQHAIRHEPMHIGQISWILKVQDQDSTP